MSCFDRRIRDARLIEVDMQASIRMKYFRRGDVLNASQKNVLICPCSARTLVKTSLTRQGKNEPHTSLVYGQPIRHIPIPEKTNPSCIAHKSEAFLASHTDLLPIIALPENLPNISVETHVFLGIYLLSYLLRPKENLTIGPEQPGLRIKSCGSVDV